MLRLYLCMDNVELSGDTHYHGRHNIFVYGTDNQSLCGRMSPGVALAL